MHHLGHIVPREFYVQPTDVVAREALGKLLVVRSGDELLAGRIVEAEAYLGAVDEASHSYRGQTQRNAAMFGPPGHAYVYFSYGVHWMFNLVTQAEGIGEAVLIRSIEPVKGVDRMRANLGYTSDAPQHRIGNGPGKVAKAMGINRERHNSADLCEVDGTISLFDDGHSSLRHNIVTTTRIGITKAAHEALRFYDSESRSISRR